MNRIIDCRFENCGGGIFLGDGTQAYIEGCEAVNCGVGYTFHQNSNVQMIRSSSINNQVGVDIIESHANTNAIAPNKLTNKKVNGRSRNKPCPCGSGLKTKKCHPYGI